MNSIQGLAFPFRIDPTTGGVSWSGGREKIRQNIRLILGTRVGERPMVRDFGTRVHALVHEPNDSVLADLLRNQVQQALLQWEPRILVTAARVRQIEGELRLEIEYVHTTEALSDRMTLPLT
jgi:uncharacterized protein